MNAVPLITVRDRDVHHWLWRLRELADAMPRTVQAATACSLSTSLRRETVGLYVDAPVVRVPEDLAKAVLAVLDMTAACCVGTVLADEARADAALLALALIGGPDHPAQPAA
ncbi:MAG TPA: hypothetical protein VHE83_06165 [Mycobacteriales bacterium]|nr:hypothetical protein [Mycobacteriales bacterium]